MNMNEVAAARIGLDENNRYKTIFDKTTIEFATVSTNKTLLTLKLTNPIITYLKTIGLGYAVTYDGNPNDVNLTIGVLTYHKPLSAPLTDVPSTYWDTVEIDLTTDGDGTTEERRLEDINLQGGYVYVYVEYSADPGNDIDLELELFGI